MSGDGDRRGVAYALFQARLGNRTASEEASIKYAWHAGWGAAMKLATENQAELNRLRAELAEQIARHDAYVARILRHPLGDMR